MLPQFIHAISGSLQLLVKKIKKPNLAGSTVYASENKDVRIELQEFRRPLFNIGYRLLRCFKKTKITIVNKEEDGIRLEAVLTGELPSVSSSGEPIVLQSGHYHFATHPGFMTLFKKDTACRYFVTHYSAELLDQIGIKELVQPSPVKLMPETMQIIIQKILHNPYKEKLLDFHHDNCIRELLLLHLTDSESVLPGNLRNKDIAAIYAADAILQEDLSRHYSIPVLAQKAETNAYTLKRGFQKVFKMGVFERLTFHRMEHAKLLLQSTNKTMDDIATIIGYNSRNSFITVFKRSFAVTPGQWRLKPGTR